MSLASFPRYWWKVLNCLFFCYGGTVIIPDRNCYNIDSNIVEQSRHLPNGQDVYDAVIDWQPPSEQIYKVGLKAIVDMYVFLK